VEQDRAEHRHGRHRGQDDDRQEPEPLAVAQLREPRLERHRQQEARQDLHARLGDPQLLEDLVPVPVQALAGQLPAAVVRHG